MTVTGKTPGENLADMQLVENDVIFLLSSPKKNEGGLAILHGNLAPDGAVIKNSGVCITLRAGRYYSHNL